MEINKAFPILDSIKNNVLTNNIFDILYKSGYTDGIAEIKKSFPVFLNTPLKIDFLSKELHNLLLQTSVFFKAGVMLRNSDKLTGLLLLPDTIYSDFTNVPVYVDVDTADYPINSILYAWSSFDDLDKRLGVFNEEWGDNSSRNLLILPIHNNKITQATDQYHMICNDELYGSAYSQQEGRCWYGKIHDYVMSFIIYQEIGINYQRLSRICSENTLNFVCL